MTVTIPNNELPPNLDERLDHIKNVIRALEWTGCDVRQRENGDMELTSLENGTMDRAAGKRSAGATGKEGQ